MNILWTQEALAKLLEIETYIAGDSPERAAKFIDQLIAHTQRLSEQPYSGRMVPEISQPDIRELIYKKYRIVYRIKTDRIEILTIFEGHRLLRTDETI